MDDRSRSRTPSRTRRKGRSPAPSDHYTYSDATYSDSFTSEDESTYGRKSQPSKGKVRGNKKGSKSNGKTNTATRKKPLGRTSQVQSHSPRNTDYVTKRMLSARRMKINELRNELEGLNVQVVELRQENKLLKREKHLNEKAIDRFEDRENDVPNLIQRHSEELRALKEQLRRQKQKYLKADKKLKDTEDELDRTKRLLRKMKGLVEDKKLGEREELSKKLTKLESELEDKDHKLKGVERHVENLQKNHKHEMGIERARHRETQQQLAELREEVSRVNTQLKEREKELDVRNIYSKRMMKAPHRLNSSITSSPIPDLNYNSKPPRKPKSSEPEMTPREKMKIYNEKRRDEEKRHRESPVHDDHFEEEAEKRREKGQQEDLRRQQELEDAKREEEKERMAEKAEQEARRRKAEEERAEAREQEQWDAERERKKQESQTRKEREEQRRREKLERERQEEEDRKRLQREEEERRERERQFQREQEERERQLRENEKFRKEQEEKDSEQRKQKELLLARMREIDSQKKSGPPEVSSPTSKKNEYNFKQSIENMHHGKPAYDDVAVPVLEKQKKKNFLFDDDDDDDNDSGGYKPTFSAGTKNTRAKKGSFKIENDTVMDFSGSVKQDKKKNLMEDLFGNSSSTTGKSRHTNGDSDLVLGSSKGQSGKNRRGMRESSSTALFGGGNAIVDDDDTPPNNNGSQLLPRRTKQPSTTFHTRPAVNAVDDLDDDIEEVVL